MTKILMQIKGENMEVDFPDNHCIFCQHIDLFVNKNPCNLCFHSSDPPGRHKPLFKPKSIHANIEEVEISKPLVFRRKTKLDKNLKQTTLF